MNKQIGFTSLTVKAVDSAKRMIRGIATTPTPDRVNDVVEPLGITFKNPAVLLWMHRHDEPVGSVTFGKPTAKGVPFEATFPEISAPSQLAARVEEAFQSCVSGLIRHVSIGFRPIEYSVIQETGGLRFTKSEVYELSLVSVPAQPDASFEVVKQFDAEIRASMGGKDEVYDENSGSTEKPKLKSVKLTSKENKMNLSEKIKDFKAELATKSAKMNDMMEKSLESGETFDSAQEEEYQTLESEVKALESHIEKAEKLQSAKAKTATAVDGSGEAKAAATRQGFQVKSQPKLEKGIEFARLAMCKFAAQGNAQEALNIAKTQYGTESGVAKALELETGGRKIEQIMKATVEAGTTLDATWAAPLVEYQNFAGDFVEYLRPRTILGQFGQGNVPSLRRIPFNVRIPAQTSGGAAYWVGEGAPKPLTSFDFSSTEHRWNKVASIAVLTEELIRFSDPSAERLVRDSLADAVIARTDIDFIDPAKALVANVSPASITNGATAIPSRGSTAEDVRCDLQALWAPFIAANNAPRTAVYIMNSTTALAVSLMVNALGTAQEFPGLTMNGGTLLGVPAVVSDYVPEGIVVLVNASDIYLSDDGQVTVDASREASLQMLDNPTNNSATGTATSMVSMFQTNSVALRAERYINWSRRRASGVAYLTGVTWGACATA